MVLDFLPLLCHQRLTDFLADFRSPAGKKKKRKKEKEKREAFIFLCSHCVQTAIAWYFEMLQNLQGLFFFFFENKIYKVETMLFYKGNYSLKYPN